MKSPHSQFIEEQKIKSQYIGQISKKSTQKAILSFISPFNKLQDVFQKRQNIQKNELEKKKYDEKKKTMTCINLGVDQEYLEFCKPTQPGLKIKSRQICIQSQGKNRSKVIENNKQQSHLSNKTVPKSQSQNRQRSELFQFNRQKQNLIKFEKKLFSNLQKKKNYQNHGKTTFNQTFKQLYYINNTIYNQFSQPTLNIKREKIHQVPFEIEPKDEDKKPSKPSKVANSKQNIIFHRYNSSHNDRFYLHRKLSQGQIKPSITQLLHYQNEIQEQISLNHTLDSIKIQKHKSQSHSSSNIRAKNDQSQHKINNLEINKTKIFDHQFQSKKFQLNRLQRDIRSLNVSAHTKLLPSQKKLNLKEKLSAKQRAFIKCRNTCPVTQHQSVFTPWDHLPSERSFLDEK